MSLLASLALFGAWSNVDDSPGGACAAWEAAVEAHGSIVSINTAGSVPDTSDLRALEDDVAAALNDLEATLNAVTVTKQAVQGIFAEATAEDLDWQHVHEAAYELVTLGKSASQATVKAACDRR